MATIIQRGDFQYQCKVRRKGYPSERIVKRQPSLYKFGYISNIEFLNGVGAMDVHRSGTDAGILADVFARITRHYEFHDSRLRLSFSRNGSVGFPYRSCTRNFPDPA